MSDEGREVVQFTSSDYPEGSRRKEITEETHSHNEGLDARQTPSDSKPSVVKHKVGRKRGARSMGRYPFLTWVNKFLKARGQTYAEATRKELERRYRRMEKDLKMLVESGKVNSANPEKMSAEDVYAYAAFQKSKKMKEKAINHNLSALGNLLTYAENSSVQQFRVKYPSAIPKNRNVRLPPLDDRDYQKILKAARTVEEFEWRRLEAYALVITAICTGMRNKEIRLSQIEDINPIDWVFRVEHVKGEDSYGQSRTVDIRPDAWEILNKYLRVRSKMVEEKCPGNKALFPAIQDKGDGFFASNSVQKLKELVGSETGVNFNLRTCRRTYGQMAIDKGVPIDSVSVLLGHKNTKTTEDNYCRKRPEIAIREAKEVFKAENSYPDVKNPKIETNYGMSGYA